MARPLKNNADYFSHDSNMRNDYKVKALRRKFGHNGYAVWCFLLEVLTDSDSFEIELTEINNELLSADFDISVEELNEIIDYCVKIDLLKRNENFVFSETLNERFYPLISKRQRDREFSNRKNNEVIADDNITKTNNKIVFANDNPTVKYSKVKYSKVKNNIKEKDIEKEKINLTEKNPPNSTEIPNSYFVYLSQMKNEFEKNVDWQNSFCKNNNVSPEILQLKIKEFLIKLQNENCVGENWDQLFKHFANWYKLGIKNQSKFTDNGNKRRKIDTSIPHSAEHL